MTTYRVGNHHGVTIVRETPVGEIAVHAELVAVVTNGDRALAERICALLNGEAPAWQRRTHPGETWAWPTECAICYRPIGPWDPSTIGSAMTHIVTGGGADFAANQDHEPRGETP